MARAAIGVPIYRGDTDHLRVALDSLLDQTYRDAAFLIVDDGAEPAGALFARERADADPRTTYHRNERRLGLGGSWRRAFELAVQLHPEVEYFSWGSDHDVWAPAWLERLVAVLDREPATVLAYPAVELLDPDGAVRRRRPSGSTAGVSDPAQRLAIAYWRMRPGDMVYGLFRREALQRSGVFRPVLVPDRLLLAELALCGTFVPVPEPLWTRRMAGAFSLARQRAALFPDGAPVHARLPWWVVHDVVIARELLAGRSGPAGARLLVRVRLAALHVVLNLVHVPYRKLSAALVWMLRRSTVRRVGLPVKAVLQQWLGEWRARTRERDWSGR